MLTKEQALAAMDAQIIRVEAEQRRRLERRVAHLSRIYPALRQVPLEQRAALRDAADRHTLRHWTTYAAMGSIVTALALFLLREPVFGIQPLSRVPDVAALLGAYASMALVIHSGKRSWLKRVVAARRRDGGQPGHG